jgi:hypothetical protein
MNLKQYNGKSNNYLNFSNTEEVFNFTKVFGTEQWQRYPAVW